MAILVTGAAGFIGFHVAQTLLERGERVIGLDNLDPYYTVDLKHDRLQILRRYPEFRFSQTDISDAAALTASVAGVAVLSIVHLAAQAGVRYSLENPSAYSKSNLVGHLNILEMARHTKSLKHLVYASSSSVYGGREGPAFKEADRIDQPISLYAATKVAGEALSYSYAHLYGIPQTGLRFFTVYGPWGRPDMAYWMFAEAIFQGKPLRVFAEGKLRRDFTWIGDIVSGVLAAVDRPPAGPSVPHKIYNLGGSKTHTVLEMIDVIERASGRKAQLEFLPMQPGDVPLTSADITLAARDLGYQAKTSLAEGLPQFIRWFADRYKFGQSRA